MPVMAASYGTCIFCPFTFVTCTGAAAFTDDAPAAPAAAAAAVPALPADDGSQADEGEAAGPTGLKPAAVAAAARAAAALAASDSWIMPSGPVSGVVRSTIDKRWLPVMPSSQSVSDGQVSI